MVQVHAVEVEPPALFDERPDVHLPGLKRATVTQREAAEFHHLDVLKRVADKK
jgi:hypothetical protein